MTGECLEISDLITDCDPVTGQRKPVSSTSVLDLLGAAGDQRAARIVARIPTHHGVLDERAVDTLLVRVHTELQRLSEELRLGERMAEALRPLLAAIRSVPDEPIRIVDVGCGLGYVVRWLAATGALGPQTELVGVDLNAALVAEAERLAAAEGLHCQFRHADAFGRAIGGQLMISTGLLHHLRGSRLAEFFACHDQPDVRAFCHFDIAATRLAPLGARVFHQARMRQPLGRHDGVASARRAHSDAALLTAARSAGDFGLALFEPKRHASPFCATIRPVVGVRGDGMDRLRAQLGRRARWLRTPPEVTTQAVG